MTDSPDKRIQFQTSSKEQPTLLPTASLQNRVTGIAIAHLISGPGMGEMAGKLAEHWLRDAAKRIFHDHLRSFLEVVVNALDASLPPEKGCGKFGMGFISILSFLDHEKTEGCEIHIQTTTQDLVSYSMDLFKEEDKYQVRFIDQQPQRASGTTLTIHPKAHDFAEKTLEKLFYYCNSLQFYEHGTIEVSYNNQIYKIGEGKNVLAWIILSPTKIVVEDKGCGISKEVAFNKLFVPSLSTKRSTLDVSIRPSLPTFKECADANGKGHFFISVNGVTIINLPIEDHKNLLLRMPPSTQLTLARDAVENRPETIQYLKEVIRETLKQALISKENAKLFLTFYKGLQAWESFFPSIKEARLVNYLKNCIDQAFKNSALIPYPIEHEDILRPILPKNNNLIPFPAELLFDHFGVFEQYIEKHYDAYKRKDLICSKTVLFVEEIEQISSLGMKNLIFAPRALLAENFSEKALKFSLVTQFADEGKILEAFYEQHSFSLPLSLELLRGPKQFMFFSGVDSPPTFSGNINLQNTLLFKETEDTPFAEAWAKMDDLTLTMTCQCSMKFDTPQVSYCLPALIAQDGEFFQLLATITKRQKIQEVLESLIITDDDQYWYIKDVEGALNFIEERARSLKEDTARSKKLEKILLHSEFKDTYFISLTTTEVSKYIFAWLFIQAGIPNQLDIGKDQTIYTANDVLWPPEKITCDYLEECFETFIEKKGSKPMLPSHWLKKENVWKSAEPFMDYPQGSLAILKILPLLLFEEEILKSDIPSQLKEKTHLFVQHTLSLYHNFFTIKLNAVTTTYGTASMRPFEDKQRLGSDLKCTVNDLMQLLKSLTKNPPLFEKCLDLFSQQMAKRLDIQQRNQKFSMRKTVTVEDFLYDHGVTLLSRAKAHGIDQSYIETILHYANTPFELYLSSLLMLSEEARSLFSQQDGAMKSILIHIISIYIQGDIEKLAHCEKEWQRYYLHRNVCDHIYIVFKSLLPPILNYLRDIKKTAFETDKEMIPEAILEQLKFAQSFTTLQIIHTAKMEAGWSELLQKGELKKAVALVCNAPKESELQMVKQAVEHGSERSPIAATLIEAFQNSVDAIRGYLKKHPEAPEEKSKVSFDVRIIENETCNLLLEIADQIGMESLETLLADFLIPNYSRKEREAEAVGEMGNGSYQMYRDAEMVTIKTRTLKHPSKVYFLRIIPIRNPQTGEVEDLQHTCADITHLEPAFTGTTLRFLKRKERESSKVVIELEGLKARTFIQETFSVAHPTLSGKHPLHCELKLSQDKKEQLNAIVPNFSFVHGPFSCYKMKNPLDVGFVLTDGYPFKSLEVFLVEEKLLPAELAVMVSKGWCINLPKGTYEPVQSRTRLQLNQKIRKELRTFLLEWIYFSSLSKESLGQNNHSYYPHLLSKAEFDQVYPYAPLIQNLKEMMIQKGDLSTLQTFFVHYKPSFLQKSFIEYIDEGYKTLVPYIKKLNIDFLENVKSLTAENREKNYNNLVVQYKNHLQQAAKKWIENLHPLNDYERAFFESVLIPWFAKKIKGYKKSIPELKKLCQTNTEMQTDAERIEIAKLAEKMIPTLDLKEQICTATFILTQYCENYSQIISIEGKLRNNPQLKLYYDNTARESAYYVYDSHTIKVNLASFPLSKILTMGEKIASYEVTKNALISILHGQSGALNHELEHARRGESCGSKNPHAEGINTQGQYVCFEACASSYAKKAHTAGLFVKWAQDLQRVTFFPSQEALANLREIEKQCPKMLIEAIDGHFYK